MIQNDKRFMTDEEYNNVVKECRKAAYEYTMEELEEAIDTGYDYMKEFSCHGPSKMVLRCKVVLDILVAVLKARTDVICRNNKINSILSEEADDEWWIF